MEKVKESNIMGYYFIKTYTSDGMGFIEALNNLSPDFVPISVELIETADRDMKSFGTKTIPYEEYMEKMDTISEGPIGVSEMLIGTVGGSLVKVSCNKDFITIMTENKDVEIGNVINQPRLGF